MISVKSPSDPVSKIENDNVKKSWEKIPIDIVMDLFDHNYLSPDEVKRDLET